MESPLKPAVKRLKLIEVTTLSYKSLRERSRPLLERAEYSKERGEIWIAGADWILMRSATSRDLIKRTEKILVSGAVLIWLEAGRHAGKEFMKAILKKEGIEPEKVAKGDSLCEFQVKRKKY